MRLALTSNLCADEPLESALRKFSELAITHIELSVDTGFKLVELDELLEKETRVRVQSLLSEHGIGLTALSNHRDGQLVLGPHHEVTDGFFMGTPEEKRAYGVRRMTDTARAADAMGVRVVTGFTGCPDYSRWFHWPGQAGWEIHYEALQEAWTDILKVYQYYGVKFAHELHPKQVVYEQDSARRSVEIFSEFDEWGFNLDTGNLILAGVDPIDFIREFGQRIWHVHAKDVEHTQMATREHFIAHPKYGEIGRNFRFRVPGWGELNWRKILTELHLAGYDGFIAVENEDPTMERFEGAQRGIDYMRGLMLEAPRESRWW